MKSKTLKNTGDHGFSLVEMMVVIGIISVLSAIANTKLQSSAIEAEIIASMASTKKAIEASRATFDQVLKDLTGSNCSACSCWGSRSKWENCGKNIPNSLKKAFKSITMSEVPAPAGFPILIDENEMEFSTALCRVDTIHGYNPVNQKVYTMTIPNYSCPYEDYNNLNTLKKKL